MKTLVLGLVAFACINGLPLADPANAEPLVLSRHMVDNAYVKRPMYCDQYRRCWTEGYRNALLDSYTFLPPPRHAGSDASAAGKVAATARMPARVIGR